MLTISCETCARICYGHGSACNNWCDEAMRGPREAILAALHETDMASREKEGIGYFAKPANVSSQSRKNIKKGEPQ